MPGPGEIAVALVAGIPLWVVGLHVFDFVHWVLHGMLRSRWRVLRWLASPHAMHHRWLDRELKIHWENQRANLWGHIVLEYATQLVFSGALLLVLPASIVAATVAYQTLVFAYILSQRGLDPNHRPIEMLDAYQPSFLALPAYHALHHVYPDAYYSAYSKLIDYLVSGGTQLRGRRVALVGTASSAFARSMTARLLARGIDPLPALDPLGAEDAKADGSAPQDEQANDREARLAGADILVLCDPTGSPATTVEAFVRATRRRQLPPEVWAVHTEPGDALARHYYRDPRVTYRVIVIPADELDDPECAARAAARAIALIRRGFNFVPTSSGRRVIGDFLAFRRTQPAPPVGASLTRHRAALALAA